MIEKATMESKTKTATWKSIKTYSETGVKNNFTLFEATYRKNKQCHMDSDFKVMNKCYQSTWWQSDPRSPKGQREAKVKIEVQVHNNGLPFMTWLHFTTDIECQVLLWGW